MGLVKVLCKILGKEAVFQQLCGSLQVNCSKAKKLLNWQPKRSLQESLLKVGSNYKDSNYLK